VLSQERPHPALSRKRERGNIGLARSQRTSPLPHAGEADARSAAGEGRRVMLSQERPHPALSRKRERGNIEVARSQRTSPLPHAGEADARSASGEGRRVCCRESALTLPSPASGRGEISGWRVVSALRLSRSRERPTRGARRVRDGLWRRAVTSPERPHSSPLPQAGEGELARKLWRGAARVVA